MKESSGQFSFGDGFACEMDLMTFASVPRDAKQSDGNFPVLSPVV